MVISLLRLQQQPFNGSPYLQRPHNLRSELAKTPISFCHFTVWNLCRPPTTLRIKFKLFKVTHRPRFMICVLSPSLAVACFTLSWTVVHVILIFYSLSDVQWCYLPPCLCTFIFLCLESPLSDSHLTWWTQRLNFFWKTYTRMEAFALCSIRHLSKEPTLSYFFSLFPQGISSVKAEILSVLSSAVSTVRSYNVWCIHMYSINIYWMNEQEIMFIPFFI